MKSYTDIEQSKKLAEILPLESADMYYSAKNVLHANTLYSSCDKEYFELHNYIPAWGLAALLDVLQYPTLLQREDKKWECTAWIDFTKPHSIPPKGSPIDACYEMIMRLHELKML